MSTTTSNLELTKWADTDYVNFEELNNNFQKLDAALNDSVIEQGNSGIWYYRKWRSGFCELFGEAENEIISASDWTTEKTGLYYKELSSAPFPFETLDTKVVSVTPCYKGGVGGVFLPYVLGVYDDSNNNSIIKYRIITFDKTNVFNGSIVYNVVGRWSVV